MVGPRANRKSGDLAGVLTVAGLAGFLRELGWCLAAVAMFVSDFRKEFYEVLQSQVKPFLSPEAWGKGRGPAAVGEGGAGLRGAALSPFSPDRGSFFSWPRTWTLCALARSFR